MFLWHCGYRPTGFVVVSYISAGPMLLLPPSFSSLYACLYTTLGFSTMNVFFYPCSVCVSSSRHTTNRLSTPCSFFTYFPALSLLFEAGPRRINTSGIWSFISNGGANRLQMSARNSALVVIMFSCSMLNFVLPLLSFFTFICVMTIP